MESCLSEILRGISLTRQCGILIDGTGVGSACVTAGLVRGTGSGRKPQEFHERIEIFGSPRSFRRKRGGFFGIALGHGNMGKTALHPMIGSERLAYERDPPC